MELLNKRKTEGMQEFKKADKFLIITKNLEKTEEGIAFIPLWKWLLIA